jgi:hypothetical protein
MARGSSAMTLTALLLCVAVLGAAADRQLLEARTLRQKFETLSVVGDDNMPKTPNVNIVPGARYKVETEVDHTWKPAEKMLRLHFGKSSKTAQVTVPSIAAFDRLQLRGANWVTLGSSDTNIKADGTCRRLLNLVQGGLTLDTKGEAWVTVDCLHAAAGAPLRMAVEGVSMTISEANNKIDELEVVRVKGDNWLTVNGHDSVVVNKISMKKVFGTMLLDIRKPSTQLLWSPKSGFGGEMLIKTVGGVTQCPESQAGQYTGPPLGKSRYCCGPTVDLAKKLCPAGNVKAGQW